MPDGGSTAWRSAADATTTETRRLLDSVFDTYDNSKVFYADAAAEAADGSTLHQPEEGETVAVLVTDRHDNIGMDEVVRAIADAAGATVVLDAGDDTSTGETWEEFSLDSLDAAFEDYDRCAVAGNHDNGTFVTDYLDDLGLDHARRQAGRRARAAHCCSASTTRARAGSATGATRPA